jgi:hypothetical protein
MQPLRLLLRFLVDADLSLVVLCCRLKAICQSLSKTNAILRAYDINSFTPNDEIMERVLELVNDARVAWCC